MHIASIVTNLDDVQFQDHVNGSPNFMLKPVHLEAHAFEHNLCPSSHRDLLGESSDLGSIERRRRKQNVKLDRK